jgi:hypothetical protein
MKSGLEAGEIPSENSAIVIGRSIFFYDGKIATSTETNRGLFAPAIVSYIRDFTGIDAVKNQSSDRFAIRAFVSDSGYFAVSLPPGNYYFSAFFYPGIRSGVTGMRSYESIMGSKIIDPTITTFQAVPGKINYIGTIAHRVVEMPMLGVRRFEPRRWGWKYSVIDEFMETEEWFRKAYPQLSDFAIERSLSKTMPYPSPKQDFILVFLFETGQVQFSAFGPEVIPAQLFPDNEESKDLFVKLLNEQSSKPKARVCAVVPSYVYKSILRRSLSDFLSKKGDELPGIFEQEDGVRRVLSISPDSKITIEDSMEYCKLAARLAFRGYRKDL